MPEPLLREPARAPLHTFSAPEVILEQLPSPVAIVDAAGVVVEANPAASDLADVADGTIRLPLPTLHGDRGSADVTRRNRVWRVTAASFNSDSPGERLIWTATDITDRARHDRFETLLADVSAILAEADDIPGAAAELAGSLVRAGLARGCRLTITDDDRTVCDVTAGSESTDRNTSTSIPLLVHGREHGRLVVHHTNGFRPDETAVVTDVAHRIALAVDAARLLAERSRVADLLQRTLLPASLPHIAGIDLGVRYLPVTDSVDVGGDFYDVFNTGHGTWALAIGDVCGKGPDAAAIAGLTRHAMRGAAMHQTRAVHVLRALDDVLHRAPLGDERFVTACCGLLRRQRSGARISFASAGHPLPLVVRAESGRIERVECAGSILGQLDDVILGSETVFLGPGDLVVLHTDGVTEATHAGREFGDRRVAEILSSCAGQHPDDVAAALVNAVQDFTRGTPTDDIAVLAVRVNGDDAAHRTP